MISKRFFCKCSHCKNNSQIFFIFSLEKIKFFFFFFFFSNMHKINLFQNAKYLYFLHIETIGSDTVSYFALFAQKF